MDLELLTSKDQIGLYKHLTSHPKMCFSDQERTIFFESWNWCPEIDCHKVLSNRLAIAYDNE